MAPPARPEALVFTSLDASVQKSWEVPDTHVTLIGAETAEVLARRAARIMKRMVQGTPRESRTS
jgi:hypothetical protein